MNRFRLQIGDTRKILNILLEIKIAKPTYRLRDDFALNVSLFQSIVLPEAGGNPTSSI